jgi:hypothetical protein
MTKNIKIVEQKVDEVSSFFSIFKKSKIKEEINLTLNNINADLITIPILKTELNTTSTNYIAVKDEFKKHKNKTEKEINSLIDKSNLLTTNLENTTTEYESVKTEFNTHKDNSEKEINTLNTKHNLVSSLLTAKSTNEGLFLYKETLYKEFIDFANSESSLANEAEAFLQLQAIEKELELITAYPDLYKKNTIAVGGGFSAGKSEFISSFFNSDIKLPIGIEPTTAIPTYVMNNNDIELIGCSHKGGAVNLNEIDSDFQSKLSHNFIKSFNFNLKEIMPFMVLGTNINYEHICFIDTPGYNPSDVSDGYTSDDIGTAKEFLTNANTFIWLVGADVNGTIPSSDLDFLSNLNLEDKKLYVVLNKADLRSSDDIEDILEEIEETLDDYDIDAIGISAYSSINKKEYAFKNTPIDKFIDDCNIEAKIHKDLVLKLYEVYTMYKKALLTTIKEKNTVKSQLKSISLDLLQEGFDDTENKAFQRIDKLENFFTINEEEESLKLLEDVITKLKDAIDTVFQKKHL